MQTPVQPDHPNENARRFPRARIAMLVLVVAAAAFVLGRQDWGSSSAGPDEAVRGSGTAATQIRSLPPFRSVDLAGASSVTVRIGGEQDVVVRADDNLIDRVETHVRNGVLVVAERGRLEPDVPLAVEVTVASLVGTRVMGSGALSVDRVHGRAFAAEVLGSGTLTVAGTVDRLDARLAGSGDMRLGALVARSVTATVPGSGRLEVHASRALDASIGGSGDIVYGGSPSALEQLVTGSGAILPRE
jgi:hypothetical protein